MTDEIKKAELSGYSRGYNAGVRRVEREDAEEQRRASRQALMDQMFLLLLPIAMTAEGWSMNGKPVSDGPERIELAAEWARQALRKRPLA